MRVYVPHKSISHKDIRVILKAITLAPSAGNLQGFKAFVITKGKEKIKLNACCFRQRSNFIEQSSCVFVLCTNPKETIAQYGERGKTLYTIQDATIAATYAMLAATALNYATCWVGAFKESEVQNVLGTSLRPVALIVVGFPSGNPRRPARKPLDEIAEIR